MLRNFTRTIIKPTYLAVRGLRSASDSGYYPEIARRASQNASTFATFKRNEIYRGVLEHVSEELGAQYLEQIQTKWPLLIEDIEKFKINDEVGDPIRVTYPHVGEISPTTLRYLKVACDLRELFGELAAFNVVEIGGGYGGQFLLADRIWQVLGIHLTQVGPTCSVRGHGRGLSTDASGARAALQHRAGLPGVPVRSPLAGRISLSSM